MYSVVWRYVTSTAQASAANVFEYTLQKSSVLYSECSYNLGSSTVQYSIVDAVLQFRAYFTVQWSILQCILYCTV